MVLEVNTILRQIDGVLDKWNSLKSRARYSDCSDLPDDEITEIITLIDSTINRLTTEGSRYRENAQSLIDRYGADSSFAVSSLPGILKALRHDYENGFLNSVQELIHSDLFADFLERAEYLLNEGFKDPSAVLIGGVLEEHIRKLCLKHSVPIEDDKGRPKKADRMNSDLASSGAYSKLDQKSVTSWLDLRNKAAHGKYDEYTVEQVALLLQSVRDFILRNPA